MSASLIVGSWWSYAAVRAGRRRLACYLAAWPMGVVAFIVGMGPLAWAWSLDNAPHWDELLLPLVAMCLNILLR